MTIDANERPPAPGIHHIAVQTHDLQASIHLYRDLLGMSIVNEWVLPERKFVLLAAGGSGHIELVAPTGAAPLFPSDPPAHPLLHLALTTTDIRKAVEQVRKAGYEITIEPKEVQLGPVHATIAFFNGPSGERIEFFETN